MFNLLWVGQYSFAWFVILAFRALGCIDPFNCVYHFYVLECIDPSSLVDSYLYASFSLSHVFLL